jgi:type II secretory pathway component PulF
MALPALFTTGGAAYLKGTLPLLATIYAGGFALYLAVNALREAGTTSPALDQLLGFIPWIGKVRRAFSCARFCTIYHIELDAGVNVIDALISAGRSSRSARINAAVQAAVPQVRSGSQVGPLLARSGVFPETMARSLVVGEESGELDRELEEMAAEYHAEALRRLDTAAGALTKLLYVGVLLYVGGQVVFGYQTMLTDELKVLDL